MSYLPFKMASVSFTSENVINKKRQELQEARNVVLEKAKKKYEKEEKRKEQARLRGEDTWMLPSVSDRIQNEQAKMDRVKKKHKKEKKKKKKNKKKLKKKAASESDSESDSENEGQWVEKTSAEQVKSAEISSARPVQGPTLQRDSWMMESPIEVMPMVSRQDIRERQKKEKEEKEEPSVLDQLGQHERELNPYWKDGGTGLPEKKKKQLKPGQSQVDMGDGGLSWLQKSYQRCKEQAADEGRSLEEVAAERWGSLKKLETLLADAQTAHQNKSRSDRVKDYVGTRCRSRSPAEHRRGALSREKWRHQNDSYSSSRHKRRSHSRSPDRRHHRSRSPVDERNRERRRNETDREKEYREDKNISGRDSYDSRLSGRSESSSQRRFMRPGEMGTEASSSRSVIEKEEPRWKKRGFVKPEESTSTKLQGHSQFYEEQKSSDRLRRKYSPHGAQTRSRSRSRSRSFSSSDSSEDSDTSKSVSRSDEEEDMAESPKPPPATLLTEEEMNALGAKILRAELMGDEMLCQELKSKLEAARKLKANPPNAGAQGSSAKSEPEEVVLIRTGRGGMIQPLPSGKHEGELRGKKRRKQQTVTTHGDGGERLRYFDDDDQHSLKSLVAREKMGTAEDQNAMFSRLAGKTAEKTDEDFQIDDVFVSKAARKQSEARNEEWDRSRAIFEHRKMNSAMEKCHLCFETIPKHLIIAIGVKVYLCLPNHRSLTPGHCLIVPMQHVASGTAVDEDTWQEIQTFRKVLVQMFASQGEDVVFMETSMHLKRFPHLQVECIPLEREIGDMAPIYFKKAIQDSESEWSNNKKVIDLSKKDIRHSVPKGFPYFSVDFGLQGGFAHVIEEEHNFPSYFGREIVGGMIDAEPQLWRKPHKENFDDQRRKVLEFADWWKPFDFTQQSQE